VVLTTFDPFAREFDRIAQRAFGWTNTGTTRSVMRMDAVRRDGDIVLRFDLPGIDADSVEVTVEGDVLTVGARRAEELAEGEKPFIRERVVGSFSRRLYLGESADADNIEARYRDGVLTVRVPLAEKAQPRKVEIRTDAKPEIAA
jgi:HSP20 family protein